MSMNTILSSKYFLSEDTETFDSVMFDLTLDEDDSVPLITLSGGLTLNLGGGVARSAFVVYGDPTEEVPEMTSQINRAMADIIALQDAVNHWGFTALRELSGLLTAIDTSNDEEVEPLTLVDLLGLEEGFYNDEDVA